MKDLLQGAPYTSIPPLPPSRMANFNSCRISGKSRGKIICLLLHSYLLTLVEFCCLHSLKEAAAVVPSEKKRRRNQSPPSSPSPLLSPVLHSPNVSGVGRLVGLPPTPLKLSGTGDSLNDSVLGQPAGFFLDVYSDAQLTQKLQRLSIAANTLSSLSFLSSLCHCVIF